MKKRGHLFNISLNFVQPHTSAARTRLEPFHALLSVISPLLVLSLSSPAQESFSKDTQNILETPKERRVQYSLQGKQLKMWKTLNEGFLRHTSREIYSFLLSNVEAAH